jgi:hypothetical protein
MGQSNRIYQKGDRVTQRKFREQNLRDTWWRLVGNDFSSQCQRDTLSIAFTIVFTWSGHKGERYGGRGQTQRSTTKDRQEKIGKKRSATKLSPQS